MASSDPRVEDFVCPIIILEGGSKRIIRLVRNLPFVALTCFRHETFFDIVEHAVAREGRKTGIEIVSPEMADGKPAPVDSLRHKSDLAHESMTRFIPELPSHIGIIGPGFVRSFPKDASHHFGYIDLTESFEKKDQ
jgi:hypothetical protein